MRALRCLNSRLNYRRERRVFDRFVQERIRLSRDYETAADLMNDPPQADIYCTGSDQTWNSIYNGGILPEYFVAYAPEGKKRVALAASFGRDDIDAAELEATKPFIQKYSAISVRESSALA